MKRYGVCAYNTETKNFVCNKEMVTSYANYLVKWLQTKVRDAHAKGVIVGLSGGIDSTLVAALAQKAFPDNHLAVVMPIDSMAHEQHDLKAIISHLHLKTITVDLAASFQTLTKQLMQFTNLDLLPQSNIKPRLRMTTLYALAQQHNYLVLGTDNADEYHIGYFTKFGDGGADLLPLVHLLKCEVRALAKHLGVPDSVIHKAPSAGLWEGQSDENELGFSYADLDEYLATGHCNPVSQAKIERLHQSSQHKRDKIYQPLPFADVCECRKSVTEKE
ncbi:NAD(+) synthase [Mycoplasmopsis columbinasalis]|uniref:NH(3)-dependent NAD(+) synthetase n=1 Tax=Mycoplasmopsis columbinasalis TaxID=114880 RepID=A0A449BB20_9BACT|nr:NAD(+) synthase [Mycoplasmopsis columbinasalis]VEU78398.1 NAD+ synthetase [Mycoplasmopsis columbinasalis]